MSSLSKSKIEVGDVRFLVKSCYGVGDVVVVLGLQELGFTYVGESKECEVFACTVLSEGRVLNGRWYRGKSSDALKISDLVLSETCF